MQLKETTSSLRLKFIRLKNYMISDYSDVLELYFQIKDKYNLWKLKRWFTNYKKRKTQIQKAQLLENMQSKKIICRICEKEILMTNLKKHSINCKKLNDLNQQLKIQLKEMNSCLFYFFQQNRELQVQYTLIQKNLEKMIQNQQMLIDSRKNKINQNNTETDSQSSLDGVSILKSESVVNNTEQRKSIYYQRRNTCTPSHSFNKFGFQSSQIKNIVEQVNKNQQEQNQNKEKDEYPINHNRSHSEEKLIRLIKSEDTSKKEEEFQFSNNLQGEEKNEFVPQQVLHKITGQNKKLSKNASINITEQQEENEDVFSSSQPNFQFINKSSGSIKSNNDIKSQQGEKNSEKINKKLPDIQEEEITSPILIKQNIKNVNLNREILFNQKSAQNLDRKDQSFEYKNQNTSWYSAGSILGKTKLSDSEDNQKDKFNTNLVKTTSGISKSSYKEENSKENDTYQEDEKVLINKINEIKSKPTSSKQLNLITNNQDESISINSLQQILSNNKNGIFNFDYFNSEETEQSLRQMLFQTLQEEEQCKAFQKYLEDRNENLDKIYYINEEQQKTFEGIIQKLSSEQKQQLINLQLVSNQLNSNKNSQNQIQIEQFQNSDNEGSMSNLIKNNDFCLHQILNCTKNKQQYQNSNQIRSEEINLQEKVQSNYVFNRPHVHFPDIPLQTIQEQKIENENQDNTGKQQQVSDFPSCCQNQENEQFKSMNNGFGIHEFSLTSLSSSLSEVDLMVADFFKKIQIKNEKERNFIQQLDKESKISSDANFIGSQWVFSQEFSPKGNKLLQNHSNYLDTLNFIDSNLISSQMQQKQNQAENNNALGDKVYIQATDRDLLEEKNKINKHQNQKNEGINAQSFVNFENKEEPQIDQTQIKSLNQIGLNQNFLNSVIQEKNQQEAQNILVKQEITKKNVLQRLVSIDCSSQHSSTNSNFSNQISARQVESQPNCLSNQNVLSKKNIKNSHQNIQNSNITLDITKKNGGEKSPDSPFKNQNMLSRKSIRMNTIDIVTSELNDCFHTSSQSITDNYISNEYSQQESQSMLKSKDKYGSSSPRSPSGNIGNQNFSQSQSLAKQTSFMSKSSQQKSIFGQKFQRLKSESFNQSDDEMTQSEYVDQVPDLSTQVLIKFKNNQKRSFLYSQENSQDQEQNETNNNDKHNENFLQSNQENNNQIYNKDANDNIKNQIFSNHESNEKQNKSHKKSSIMHPKNNQKPQINNYLESQQQSEEKLEAKDLSYISKSSISSSSSESSSSQPSSSQYESSSSSNNDSGSDLDSIRNLKRNLKISKTPQTNRRQLNSKRQIKKKKDEKSNQNQIKAQESKSQLNPIPQRNLMRRSSLPLQLIVDLKNNGSKSEIQKDIVQLSTNFEIKIKQHEKYQCQTKLRITDLVQSLGKIFIVQDFKSTAQQKMQSLAENEKRIEFLLKKISLCTFKNKVQEIVKLFNERYKLIQQIEQVEKAIQTTIFHEKKKEAGEQSDHSVEDPEPKSPIVQTKQRRLARSGTFTGKQQNNLKISIDHRSSIDSIYQQKFNQSSLNAQESKEIVKETIHQDDQADTVISPQRKRSSDLIKNRKLKSPQQGIGERRSSHHKINFENMLSKQIEKEEDQKIEILDEILYKNSGYSSDGVLDNPYSSCAHKEKPDKEIDKNNVGIKDFDFLKLISKGAFGRVWLVRKKNTEDIYAMKIVNFAEKMNKNHLDSLKKENEILSKVQGDYVVKAVYTFTHESYICFVMEYMIGGDLGSIISSYGVLEESMAKFYIAEIVVAIHNLHQIGIIHRDLKPDNLLLDSQGHLKLTDFGLSDMGLQRRNKTASEKKKEKLKIFNNLQKNNKAFQKFDDRINQNDKFDKQKKPIRQEILEMKKNVDSLNILKLNNKISKPANRIIGTPDYIAPEILKGEGLQNPAIDWWSVGVMLFELLIGIPPFNDDTVEKIFDNIKNYRIAWDQIPVGDGEDEVSQKSVNLIKKLMHPDPKQRLGSQGIIQIQSDPFFTGIDWNNLKKTPAPIIPEVKNILDTSNFDKDKVYQEGEQIDPFFGLPKGVETVKEAKKLLDQTGFSVKRYDVLFEENQKHIEKEEIHIQKMVKELEEQEKEIEKLENECGADDSSDETNFQEIDSIISRSKAPSNSSCITKSSTGGNKKNSTDFSPFLESTISKLKPFDPLN
ncbi:Serine/Threonine kinase domain protein (macronuclear) [Tetrahymena thermophila SB210]|uniref:non-specific serine/threonine protein kinase n=1 Tax=Tetrahymena thermophila (strain SB210) TaxID=312017 RepID=Q22GW0_TETTS|nr:Serine/Threonine kinase domain protein [Tetrahymena thermophila SB210]EAR84564.2 Serine/Threonine kinase domain protein [Tetrahymena thermophila SB210]|eukprot:XP_001032227.2 Serine/Threonine kinase domain protein [Tetrahymena thermophila SB210]